MVGDGASNVNSRSGEYARSMFNADTVKIYDAGTEKMERIRKGSKVDGKYTRCKVMTIQKQDRGYYFAYCLFTDKAYKKAEKYIGGLKGMIRYNDDFTPSWKTYESIEELASDEYQDFVETTKWNYDVKIAMPEGYKPYPQMADHKKRIILNLNATEHFSPCTAMISADGNELLIYSVADSSIIEVANEEKSNMIKLSFKNLPETFINGMNVNYPSDSDFGPADADGYISCTGPTERLDRFVFLEDCDGVDMRLTPLSEIYPNMTVKQKYSGKYRVRIYKLWKQKG